MSNAAIRRLDAAPEIPVSWGELIDKITILEIKDEFIEAPEARKNVAKELARLRRIAEPALTSDRLLAEQMSALRHVNESLWRVEDRLRAKEHTQTFDAEFIELARSVYKSNDERAAIKRQINIRLSSEIVEEKSYPNY